MVKKKVEKKKKIHKTDKNPVGQPEKEINWAAIEHVLEMGLKMPSLLLITGHKDRKSIENKIKKYHGMGYGEYKELQLSKGEEKQICNMINLSASNDEQVAFKATQYLLTHIYGHSQKINVNQVSASVSYEEYLASLEKNS